jgi:hypothetical protein
VVTSSAVNAVIHVSGVHQETTAWGFPGKWDDGTRGDLIFVVGAVRGEKVTTESAIVDGRFQGIRIEDDVVKYVLVIMRPTIDVLNDFHLGIQFRVRMDVTGENRVFVVKEPIVDRVLDEENIILRIREKTTLLIIMIRFIVL